MWTREQIRKKFADQFKTRDRAQWAHSLIAGAVGPTVMAVGGAVLSATQWKAFGWCMLGSGALFCVVFGFLAIYIIPHSFYELAFELERRDERIRTLATRAKRFVGLQADFEVLSNVAVYARRKQTLPATWSLEALRSTVGEVLLPLEGRVEKVFDLTGLEYWCFAVHFVTGQADDKILKCVHRLRNYESDWDKFPPRDLSAKTTGGGHVGYTYESREPHADGNLPTVPAHQLQNAIARETDAERYVSFLSFPIFPPGSGNGEEPIGVVSVTCSKQDHFGAPEETENQDLIDDWKRYFHLNQMIAQLLSSVVGRVTLVVE